MEVEVQSNRYFVLQISLIIDGSHALRVRGINFQDILFNGNQYKRKSTLLYKWSAPNYWPIATKLAPFATNAWRGIWIFKKIPWMGRRWGTWLFE